jgi:hypothetical protein
VKVSPKGLSLNLKAWPANLNLSSQPRHEEIEGAHGESIGCKSAFVHKTPYHLRTNKEHHKTIAQSSSQISQKRDGEEEFWG